MDGPRKMFEIICDKYFFYDKKGNNRLSNLCKELESCTLKNSKVDSYDWFTGFSHLNYSIDNISIDFKNTGKTIENIYHEYYVQGI